MHLQNSILGLSIIIVAGYAGAKILRKIHFPAVTAYLLIGILIGPRLLNLVPVKIIDMSGFVSYFVLGAAAPATAPAATVMVIREYRASGPVTNMLLRVVAIDDAWCLIFSAVAITIANALHTSNLNISIIGKFIGVKLGAWKSNVDVRIGKYLTWGLVPQAGVALGVALSAKTLYPKYGVMIFTTITATTIIYELIGPLCTKYGLRKAGEI